ncbi:MAG: DHH family phosphoesterase [Kiritimatiellae bacterium]|nr:DHH family phosphoesterase [Kiritimatiellia bacterium]
MLRSEIVRRILEARGIGAEGLDAFLHPSLRDLAAPEGLPGLAEAANALLAAVSERREVVVFGDYDCDGVCATAILVKTLSALGAPVSPFLPERLSEGYGMSDESVARMLSEHPGVGLVVTVDNGINSLRQVAELRAKGVVVVVTDHHLPGDELPAADALVDPKVASPAEFENLCGAGVAFVLANRLVSEARRRGMYDGPTVGGPLLVLAGLATVTDIMPLTGQNRILVAEALRRFPSLAPTGLRELYLRAARNGVERLASKDFGFLLGPRINAAGRLASGMEALELVLSDDREVARGLARTVDDYNRRRKEIEQGMTDEAMGKVVEGAAAQVIDLPDGHPGVVGIVAARVMERLGRRVPVCVIAGGHGSARSPDGLNIRQAFASCSDALSAFGGHAAAAGFTVREGRLDDFRRMLCAYCEGRLGEVVRADGAVDAWIEASDVTLDLADDLRLLEPFGEGNEEPVFGLRGAMFSDVRPLGSDGRHLSVALRGSGLRGVLWNGGDRVESLRSSSAAPHSLRFHVVVSEYGERHAELQLLSVD